MDLPLFSSDEDISKLAQKILLRTMEICESIGINFIELPCVGNSSIKKDSSTNKLVKILSGLDNKAKQYGISFILETDLPPERNAALMENMSGLSVGLYFDMGNKVLVYFVLYLCLKLLPNPKRILLVKTFLY